MTAKKQNKTKQNKTNPRAEGLFIICKKPGLEKKNRPEAKGLVRMPKVDWRDEGGVCLAQAPQGQRGAWLMTQWSVSGAPYLGGWSWEGSGKAQDGSVPAPPWREDPPGAQRCWEDGEVSAAEQSQPCQPPKSPAPKPPLTLQGGKGSRLRRS